jgi:hypothetical protein
MAQGFELVKQYIGRLQYMGAMVFCNETMDDVSQGTLYSRLPIPWLPIFLAEYNGPFELLIHTFRAFFSYKTSDTGITSFVSGLIFE